jgi:hypothetical protein
VLALTRSRVGAIGPLAAWRLALSVPWRRRGVALAARVSVRFGAVN